MKNIIHHSFILAAIVISIAFKSVSPLAETLPNYKWSQVSGSWIVKRDNYSSYLLEQKSKARDWGYSDIINANSLVANDPLQHVNSIQFAIEIIKPAKQSEHSLLFAISDQRIFHAFRLSGDGTRLNKLQFINSSIKDTTLRPHIKWNYTITELASKDIELDYNREYRAEIRIKKNRASLYIDGKKLMEAEAPENLSSGKIGFSNRNAMLKIADVKVYNGRKIVFEDDFSKDSIKRYRVQATTMSKEEYEKRNKDK